MYKSCSIKSRFVCEFRLWVQSQEEKLQRQNHPFPKAIVRLPPLPPAHVGAKSQVVGLVCCFCGQMSWACLWYVCACVRACMRACVRARVRAGVRACTQACMHACMHVCVLACVQPCVRVLPIKRVRAQLHSESPFHATPLLAEVIDDVFVPGFCCIVVSVRCVFAVDLILFFFSESPFYAMEGFMLVLNVFYIDSESAVRWAFLVLFGIPILCNSNLPSNQTVLLPLGLCIRTLLHQWCHLLR